MNNRVSEHKQDGIDINDIEDEEPLVPPKKNYDQNDIDDLVKISRLKTKEDMSSSGIKVTKRLKEIKDNITFHQYQVKHF